MVTISREKNSLPCETEAIHTDTTPQEETRGDQLRAGARKLRSKATLQLKFSLSYILVIAAVLVLLNSYPLLVSQNLMVTSTQNGLKSTTKVIESALMGLEKLTKENVQAALEGLDESGATRVMVTNSAGLVLYDTRQGGNAVGKYALYSVVAVALRGQDASYCKYDGTAFLSRVATPVVYHNQIVGAVYAYDYDTEQAELLETFRHNLLIISLLIALLVAGLSIVLSRMLTRQISGLLQAIRHVREGAYSHRADASGTDEIAQIAAEFNSLTDRLQTTENARRRFVSDASHELRTPVTVILAECDTLERTQPTAEDYQEGVGVIRRQAQQMSRLIGQLLHITRLEQGTQKTYMERADLSALAEAVCEQQRLIAPAGTELTLDAPEPVEAQADVLLMTRVLNNLIANAFRYGKDGGHVSVTVRRENGWAVLAVRDDGIGIAPEQQERIWQRFYQVDPARSGGEGTGLGLYMVRQIARLHGGTAEVDSVPGQGSTFTVRIPAHRK